MAKKLNVIALVFVGLVVVGLVLVIVGMCTGILSATFAGETNSVTLFDEQWTQIEAAEAQYGALLSQLGLTIPSRTFTLIAFIVALAGVLELITNSVLGLLGKDKKITGLIGGAIAILGGVLILVAGFVLAGQFSDFMDKTGVLKGVTTTAGIGIWLGAIGAIIAGVAGLLGALKVGQKAE